MTKISPTNSHILIEPQIHEEFIASDRSTYNEIGVVIDFDPNIIELYGAKATEGLAVGNLVYFDSWLAAKYPKEGGARDEYIWLVKWEDVRATSYAESKVSE